MKAVFANQRPAATLAELRQAFGRERLARFSTRIRRVSRTGVGAVLAISFGLADLEGQPAVKALTVEPNTDGFVVSRSSTTAELPPALGLHVIGVDLGRSEEEVVRPDARGVVTTVQHKGPIRYGPIIKFPGHTVGDGVTPSPVRFGANDAVRPLALLGVCFPHPTGPEFGAMGWYGAILVNFGPEPLFKSLDWSGFSWHVI